MANQDITDWFSDVLDKSSKMPDTERKLIVESIKSLNGVLEEIENDKNFSVKKWVKRLDKF